MMMANPVTEGLLWRCKFRHYVGAPKDVVMREVYSGMYVSWDPRDGVFRLMPDWARGFPGIQLPHTTMAQVYAMVAAMGGDWCEHEDW